MIYKSLIQDFFYEDSGSTALSYYLTCSGETIYTGKAYNPKGIKINIRKLVEDWLWNAMPDFRGFDGVVFQHETAIGQFNLYDDEGTLLEEYKVLLSYEPWGGEDMHLNEPIDNKADPRQKFFVSSVESTGTTFDLTGWERLKITFDEALWFPSTGGTFTIGYEANSGFTISETCDWYEVSKTVISSSTMYEKGTLTFTMSANTVADRSCYMYLKQDDFVGSVCTQEGAIVGILISQDKYWYFNLENATADRSGGTVCMHYTTNYPEGELRVVLQEGLQLLSFGGGYICVSVPPNEGNSRSFLVSVYRGDVMIDGAKILQDGEYVSKYLTVTSGDGVSISKFGGDWKVTYDTNIENVYYISGARTGYTNSGEITIPISSGDPAAFHIYFYEVKGGATLATATAYRTDGWFLVLKVQTTGWKPPYNSGQTSGVHVYLKGSSTNRYLYGLTSKIETIDGWDWIYMYRMAGTPAEWTKFLYLPSDYGKVTLYPDNVGNNMLGDYYCDASPNTSPWNSTLNGYHAQRIEIGYGFNELGVDDNYFNTSPGHNKYIFPSTLTYLRLPNTINRIYNYVFSNCTNLTEIYFEGTKTELDNVMIYEHAFDNSAVQTIHCLDGDVEIA